MIINQAARAIEAAAKRQGYGVRLTSNGHLRVVAPNGAIAVVTRKVGDWRSEKNALRDVRRIGLCVALGKSTPPKPRPAQQRGLHADR